MEKHTSAEWLNKGNLEISYFSGGPGGQNVNKTMNGVRLVFTLSENYRRPGKPSVLIATCIDERSREQNYEKAFRKLIEKIRAYFYVKPKRKPTKVSRSAKEKRLKGKKIRSQIKQARRSSEY